MNVFADLNVGDRVATRADDLFDDAAVVGTVIGFKDRGLVQVETDGGVVWALHKLDLHRAPSPSPLPEETP